MPSIDKLFMIAAFVGGALFAVQLLLMFIGGIGSDAGGGIGSDAGADTGALGGGNVVHDPTNLSFKALSLQGITAFVMMFGLVGWAMRADSKASPALSLVVALAVGSVSIWVISKLFEFFNRLQSDGTIDMKRAVGAGGEVYLTVAPGKPGMVSITVGSRALTLEAVTEGQETLATGTPIRVLRVISDTRVVVVRS